MTRGCAIVFAKAPEPGRVKTRLQPALSARQAADFYAAMLADVLAATADFARALGLDAVVAIAPWESRTRVRALVPPGFRIVPQRGAGLAERMTWALREAAATGAQRILLRGSDSPTLDAATFEAAIDALAVTDLVLRPDRDGGYGLVGVRAPNPALFDHPMSTATVLADTLANAATLGLRSHVLPAGFDIDTAGDFVRLADARSQGRVAACPRSLAYLDRHALWPEVDSG